MPIMRYLCFAHRALPGPLACFPLLAALMLATPADAGLLGTSITLTVMGKEVLPVFGPTTATVINPGVEFSIVGGDATVDITDTTLTISFTLAGWNSNALTFMLHSDTAGAFTGVTWASNSFPAASFAASSTDLSFYCCTGSTISYPVTGFSAVFTGLASTPIPEPGGLALLGVGLACIAGSRRRAGAAQS